MTLNEAVRVTADVFPKLLYSFSRSVPPVLVAGKIIQLTDLTAGILLITDQLIADRRIKPRADAAEQRQSCYQADIEAITIQWWDANQAATQKLSKHLTALKRLGLLEPSLVKSDLRLHAWRLTENGQEYVRGMKACYERHVRAVFQQMSPEEVNTAVGAIQRMSDLTWAAIKAAVGIRSTYK